MVGVKKNITYRKSFTVLNRLPHCTLVLHRKYKVKIKNLWKSTMNSPNNLFWTCKLTSESPKGMLPIWICLINPFMILQTFLKLKKLYQYIFQMYWNAVFWHVGQTSVERLAICWAHIHTTSLWWLTRFDQTTNGIQPYTNS